MRSAPPPLARSCTKGQICMSTERVVVDAKIADAFAGKLAAKSQSLSSGKSADQQRRPGVLVDRGPALRVKALIDDAVDKGARLVRRQGQQHLDAGHAAGPRDPGHEDLLRRNVSAAPSCASTAWRKRWPAPTTTSMACRALVVTSALSTRRAALRHLPRQRSHRARGADAVWRRQGQRHRPLRLKAGIAEFTELRWITLQTTPRHYPLKKNKAEQEELGFSFAPRPPRLVQVGAVSFSSWLR